MNGTKDFFTSCLAGTMSSSMDRGMAMVYFSAAAIACSIFVQLSLSWIYANAKVIWLFMSTCVRTPTKFVTFLLLGQAPLRYFGYLQDFPVSSVIRMACIGGFSFVIPHFIYDVRNPAPEPKKLTEEEEYNLRHQKFEIDRALQEKLTFLLVCEINQTALAVLIGLMAMWYSGYPITMELLELLITTALFGPSIFFALFVLAGGVLIGIKLASLTFRNWWHGWTGR